MVCLNIQHFDVKIGARIQWGLCGKLWNVTNWDPGARPPSAPEWSALSPLRKHVNMSPRRTRPDTRGRRSPSPSCAHIRSGSVISVTSALRGKLQYLCSDSSLRSEHMEYTSFRPISLFNPSSLTALVMFLPLFFFPFRSELSENLCWLPGFPA